MNKLTIFQGHRTISITYPDLISVDASESTGIIRREKFNPECVKEIEIKNVLPQPAEQIEFRPRKPKQIPPKILRK